MKKRAIIPLLLCAALVFSGCTEASGTVLATATAVETAPAVETSAPAEMKNTVFTDRDLDGSYDAANSTSISLNGTEITCSDGAVEISGTIATIRKAGTYLLSGTLDRGCLIVDADSSDKIQLVLKGASIHSETTAPILILQADKVFITLAEGAENTLSNGGSFATEEDDGVDSVIFSRDDLTLNGSGTLTITSPGGHGIVSKDSLRITGGSFSLEVSGHGLCGKDEVSIAGGTFAITSGKDGIHGESDDPEGGNMLLAGGTYRITAGGDGISASGSCLISEGDYTISSGGGSENAAQHTSGQSFPGGRQGGGKAGWTSGSTQTPPEQPSDRKSGNRGDGNSTSRESPPQDFPVSPESPEGAETDTVSSKGIKAGELTVEGGSFHLDTADDSLHANGDLTLRDAVLELASGDDGIHADGTVTIHSGQVTISLSYEGIEGQHVRILGGTIVLTSQDDGLNAAGGSDGSGFGRRGDTFTQSGDTPSILISGGTVDITASGDGIDSNGTLEITGGNVTVCGPIQGDTSILDYDLTGVISGGSFLGTGAAAMSQSFRDTAQGVIFVKVGTQRAGTEITLTDSSGRQLLSHTPELDFEAVILSTPELISGSGYILTIGGTSQTLTAK